MHSVSCLYIRNIIAVNSILYNIIYRCRSWPEAGTGTKEKDSSCIPLSVVSALMEVTKSPPNLDQYLALNDSIVHLILNCPESSIDKVALQASYKL